MKTTVKVRIWEKGQALIVPVEGETHLQPADAVLKAALENSVDGFFEAWRPSAQADWIIGRRIERGSP